jgi:ADP-heptose:LPS heptosyltransferase
MQPVRTAAPEPAAAATHPPILSLEQAFGPRPRILILRGARFGDFLATTPALRALHRALPGARIGVVTSPQNASLAARYASIDDVFVAPAWPGVSDGPTDPATADRFFAQVHAWRADLVLQFNGAGETSNPLARRLGARLTAGIRHPQAADLDLSVPFVRTASERLRYLDVLALFGIPPDGLALDFPIQPDDDAAFRRAWPGLLPLGDSGALPLLAVHPGARSGARRWPVERYAAVVGELAAEFRLRPLVLGTETDLGAALTRLVPADLGLVNLTGRTTLGATAVGIRRSALFVGNDSALAHLAEAVGTPSVVIFGSSHPLNWGSPLQTWHRVVADWSAPCRWFRPCGCPDESSAPCLQAVQPADVLREARALLATAGRLHALARLADRSATAGLPGFRRAA